MIFLLSVDKKKLSYESKGIVFEPISAGTKQIYQSIAYDLLR